MPEASMNENNLAESREHQVGSTWKIASMKPEPKTEGVCSTANAHLRRRVRFPDAAHVL